FILVIYLLILIRLTIFKFCIVIFSNPLNSYQYNLFGLKGIINIVPFKETLKLLNNGASSTIGPNINIVLDMMYFLPLGFLMPLLFEKYNNFLRIVFISMIISIVIEIIQLFTILSVCDIDDIIFNVIGAVIGLICFKVFERIVINFKGKIVFLKIRY
ncbi:MAG: VanZ family protein, partial [Erysipelotrichaceae bacterium]